jgi:hypothetical protein
MDKKSICENCKFCDEVQSSDLVFTERVQVCIKFGIEWPFEEKCEGFEENPQH